jgi:[ribosomal protein S5]-alanine N-acetyltransferase
MDSTHLPSDPFLTGKQIFLRPPVFSDASEGPWYSWFNDPEAVKFTEHVAGQNTREAQIEFFNSIESDSSRRVFAICEVGQGEMIGVVSLQEIDVVNRRANIAIMIGNPAYRSTLAGFEAVAILTRFGFRELGLHKISAGTHELLRSWVELLGAIGYDIEAEIPDHFWDGDISYSMIFHSCYSKNYFALESEQGELHIARWARSHFKKKTSS